MIRQLINALIAGIVQQIIIAPVEHTSWVDADGWNDSDSWVD